MLRQFSRLYISGLNAAVNVSKAFPSVNISHPVKFYSRRVINRNIALELNALRDLGGDAKVDQLQKRAVSENEEISDKDPDEAQFEYYKNVVGGTKERLENRKNHQRELSRLVSKGTKLYGNRSGDTIDGNELVHYTGKSKEVSRDEQILQKVFQDTSEENSQTLQTKDVDLSQLKPVVPPRAKSLVAYANSSETVQQLVKLGVDLARIEKKSKDKASLIGRLNFEDEVKPLLLFLHDLAVPSEELGAMITKNPDILTEPQEDMLVRVNYLESKKFSRDAVARIISKNPSVLTTATHVLDHHLGFIQKNFELTGDQLRTVITRHPKIALWDKNALKETKVTFKEFLGFTQYEEREIILAMPKLFLTSKTALITRFDYLHNEMGITHKQIVNWPNVLRTRLNVIKPRFLFLKHLGRDQLDPKKENYVSLKSLVSGKDKDFCRDVAKTSVEEMNQFLKTL